MLRFVVFEVGSRVSSPGYANLGLLSSLDVSKSFGNNIAVMMVRGTSDKSVIMGSNRDSTGGGDQKGRCAEQTDNSRHCEVAVEANRAIRGTCLSSLSD